MNLHHGLLPGAALAERHLVRSPAAIVAAGAVATFAPVPPLSIHAPEQPSRRREPVGNGHLILLQRIFVGKVVLLARDSRAGNDHRVAEGALDPDALIPLDEQPGCRRHAGEYKSIASYTRNQESGNRKQGWASTAGWSPWTPPVKGISEEDTHLNRWGAVRGASATV